MSLHPYDPSRHRDACIALFDANVASPSRPAGTFQSWERGSFATFLDDLPGPFWVLTGEGGAAVACGGWARESDELLSLCWTVVDPEHQGRGVGRRLVEGILERARRGEPGARRVRLETLPATRGFFEGLGFAVDRVEPDAYAEGMDRVEMSRRL